MTPIHSISNRSFDLNVHVSVDLSALRQQGLSAAPRDVPRRSCSLVGDNINIMTTDKNGYANVMVCRDKIHVGTQPCSGEDGDQKGR